MEFGIKKCGMLVLKRGKIGKMEEILLPDGQVMKEIGTSGYKYLGILGRSVEGGDERPVFKGI